MLLSKAALQQAKKLQCNIEKAALQESGAFLPLSCKFQAPTFRLPHLGPAEFLPWTISRNFQAKNSVKNG